MKRTLRIAVELLAPPAVGLGLLLLILVWDGSGFTRQNLRELPLMFGYAYVVAALPSLVFTMAMELVFARWLSPRSWAGVLLAGALGALSGFTVAVFLLRIAGGMPDLRIMGWLGFGTGTLVGLVVMAASRLGERRGAPPLRMELR